MSEQNIFNRLMKEIGNAFGVCGLMGNLQAESRLISNNMQNSYETKLGMTDESYTAAVDNGTYTDFVSDRVGYGLAQWTSQGRKEGLLNLAKSTGRSIGDEDLQLDWLITELNSSYKKVLAVLKNATSVKAASDCVLTQFERPANQSDGVKNARASKGQALYEKYGQKSSDQTDSKTDNPGNSPLVNYTQLSPNHSGTRTHSVDRITPHCFVGQVTVERGCSVFQSPSKNASCNYVIGLDGKVGLVIDEKNRSWCSSSPSNDQRAITIECASDNTAPYAFNDAVYSKLNDLCVDICQRYGKTKLLWISDKEKALSYEPKADEMLITVHRWFANKSCPGEWLYSRLDDLASKVTSKLQDSSESSDQAPSASESVIYRVQVGAYSKKANAENMLRILKEKGFDGFIVEGKK